MIEVRHQPQSGARWQLIDTAPDWRSAVALMTGPGSWWFKEVPHAAVPNVQRPDHLEEARGEPAGGAN